MVGTATPDGGTSVVTPNAVSVEIETLTTFRNRVNAMLASLDASPAAASQIGAQQLTSDDLGIGFAEADDLLGRYQQVHQQLQTLSTALSNQINAMSITLEVSQLGYQNVEASQVSTLWTIQASTSAAMPPASQLNQTVGQQSATAGTQTGASTTASSTPVGGPLGQSNESA